MVKIFVGRLADSVEKSDLEDLFKEYGEVTDCSVLKNYGFVHMADLDEAKNAITGLDKHELKGNAINVELSTTRVQKATKIFVGNLPPETKSSDVHKLFKKYGTVIECDVIRNYAFVHMGRDTMAREAILALNNTDYNGNKISVQMARAKPNEMEGPGAMYGGDYPRGRGRMGAGMHPMRPFMPPPPPRGRMGMMPGAPRPGYMRKPPGYMQEPYMSAPPPYMRSGAGRGVGMMRPRMHPASAAAPGAMPSRDLAYDPVGRRADMMSSNPYAVAPRDREPMPPPPSAYSASSYASQARYAGYQQPGAGDPSANGASSAASAAVDRYSAAAAGYGYGGARAQSAQSMRYGAASNGRFASPSGAASGLPATVADQYAGSY